MKNLLIIVFYRINNKKIEEKGNVQKTFTVVSFDFATFKRRISLFASINFGRHITLWTCTPFGCSSYGRPHLEFLKLKRIKNDNDTNKKMKWKSLVSWKKRSNSRRDNREINKTMVREELLKKSRPGYS